METDQTKMKEAHLIYADRLLNVQNRISTAEQQFNRAPKSVKLLAVSKTKPLSAVKTLLELGQISFGENYLQDALEKINALENSPSTDKTILLPEWHFIGPIQSNKTRQIAENFSWAQSIDRLKIAKRLSEQRPPELSPLNICLQVNISNEESKSGVPADQTLELAKQVSLLKGVKLRGLMTIPAKGTNFNEQREPFAKLNKLYQELINYGMPLDTLSMGMSNDMEAAIAEGATMVRVGTDLFGAREKTSKL